MKSSSLAEFEDQHVGGGRTDPRLKFSGFSICIEMTVDSAVATGGSLGQTGSADRLQEAWSNLRPADQEKRSDGIERRLAVLAGNEWVRNVQRQRDYAREEQEPTRWSQYLVGCTGECKAPSTQQRSQDREVYCRSDEWRHPDRHPQPKSEVENVAKPKEEGEADDNARDHCDGSNDGSAVRS